MKQKIKNNDVKKSKIEISRATMGAMVALVRGLTNLGICPCCVMNLERCEIPEEFHIPFAKAMKKFLSKAKVIDVQNWTLPFEEIVQALLKLQERHGMFLPSREISQSAPLNED